MNETRESENGLSYNDSTASDGRLTEPEMNHELKKLGFMAKIFGVSRYTNTYIAGTMIILLLITAAILFLNLENPPANLWDGTIGACASFLGYLFGRNSD